MSRHTLLLGALAGLLASCGGKTTDDDTDADTDTDTDSDTDADLAAEVSGDYTGAITGPATSASYTITLDAVSGETVEVSGDDFDTFEIPLRSNGARIEQASAWTDGSFTWDAGSLNLVYDPIDLSFSGTQN